MSWIGSLAGRAETLLTLVDQAAGQALQPGLDEPMAIPIKWNNEPLTSFEQTNDDGYSLQSSFIRQIPASTSVPINLSRLNDDVTKSHDSHQQTASTTSPSRLTTLNDRPPTIKGATVAVVSGKKDKDDELFEFLNAPDTNVSGGRPAYVARDRKENEKNARPTVAAGTRDPGTFPGATTVDDATGEARRDRAHLQDATTVGGASIASERRGENEMASSLEMENRTLKMEIGALNQELSAVIKRGKDAQNELQSIRQQMADKARSVQSAQELQARLVDMQEAVGTKDAQLAILKIRLEEVNRELDSSHRNVDQLQNQNNRLLQDQSSAVGSSTQSRESLEVKLLDAESHLKQEQLTYKQLQEETMERLNSLESDKQRLSSDVGQIQRSYEDEKGRSSELLSQLKIAKSLADSAKQDLSDYKEKAMRILQSKERLIVSLKDGSTSVALNGSEQTVSAAEMDSCRQERDMIREELHHTRMALETAKLEITELELQLQQEQTLLQKRIASLEDEIPVERKKRQQVEEEAGGYKQDINKLQNELQKQTLALKSRIDDRDEEIQRLRNQVTMKSLSGNSQEELECRLRSLTESLIQKQTMLEALNTEKSSLTLQLERMEKQYIEAEAVAMRVSATTSDVQSNQEARHRSSGLLRESPTDGEIARSMKQAANTLDRFSIRLGLFLRRYPAARVFILIYMGLLHFWVFVVLMTYQQEIHKSTHQPQPPNAP